MELQPGTPVDQRYVVDARLGEGGMAVVWRVRHVVLGSEHALKVLQIASPAIRERLLREGRVQGALRHPNVVAVTDVVSLDGVPGLVMEYVDGPTLADLLRERALTLAEIDLVARGVLEGAAAAHAAGLVHRDLKPGNVLLAIAAHGLVPKVTDFGLAKALGGDGAAQTTTRSGVSMGTPAYMAPEQIRDARNVDARADVFALGAILYELATGRRAFDAPDTFSLFERIVQGQYEPVDALRPDLPARLRDAITRALSVDPAGRYGDAGELLRAWTGGEPPPGSWTPDLVDVARRLVPERKPVISQGSFQGAEATYVAEDPPPEAPPPTRPTRSRAPWAAAAALVVVAAVGAGWWVTRPDPALFTEDDAPEMADPAASARLDAAWAALVAGDVPRAEAEARELHEASPGEAGPLVVWAAAWNVGRRRPYPEVLRDSCEGDVRPGPELDLLENLLADDPAGLRAWLDLHPDDLLAGTIAAVREPKEASLAVRARDLHPDVALPWLVLSMSATDRADAVAAIDGAIARSDAPSLVAAKASYVSREEARPLFEAALARDPELAVARQGLALLLLRSGEPEAALAEAARMASAGVDDRLIFARAFSMAALSEGRVADARAACERGFALAEAEGRAAEQVEIALLALTIDEAAGADGSPIERLRALAVMPEVPEAQREHLLAALLTLEGEEAATRGDLPAAREIRRRLEALGSQFTTNVDLAIDLGEGRIDVSACATPEEGCWGTCAIAHAFEDAGRRDDATRCLAAMDTDACGTFATDVYCSAEGLAAGAERAWAAGDAEGARAKLATFRELWPKPEEGIAPVVRARAVEAALP